MPIGVPPGIAYPNESVALKAWHCDLAFAFSYALTLGSSGEEASDYLVRFSHVLRIHVSDGP